MWDVYQDRFVLLSDFIILKIISFFLFVINNIWDIIYVFL